MSVSFTCDNGSSAARSKISMFSRIVSTKANYVQLDFVYGLAPILCLETCFFFNYIEDVDSHLLQENLQYSLLPRSLNKVTVSLKNGSHKGRTDYKMDGMFFLKLKFKMKNAPIAAWRRWTFPPF